ncbi:MAG: DNA topoisomerase III, partial [Chlorobi bacterium]|nr:DNA topoisomerase III [Chlorobiota bacterium]
LSGRTRGLYDLICKKFIAAFSPDSDVSNTTVLGKVNKTEFKTTGKQILKPGWKAIYAKDKPDVDDKKNEARILPNFTEGESGPHKPTLAEKETNPPKYFTEGSLLRAMETAGKQVDDEELRDLMKENGIGRPSTRANIIETLFRRGYLRKERKRIIATSTGVQLVGSIQNELLKSAELTGQWERKLRLIERGKYDPALFMEELNTMVAELVAEVKDLKNTEKIAPEDPEELKKKKAAQKAVEKKAEPKPKCPKCGKANVIKGKTAYGCSDWKNGCDFRMPFEFADKKLTDKQADEILIKGKSSLIKGLEIEGRKINGYISFDENFQLIFEEKTIDAILASKCPKCGGGTIIKGKSAYGCTRWNSGCDYRIPFVLNGKTLSEKEVLQILKTGKSELI